MNILCIYIYIMYEYENPKLEAKVTYLFEKPMPMRFGNGYRCLLKGLPLPDWMTGGCATDTYINVDDAGYSLFPYFSSIHVSVRRLKLTGPR